MISLHKGENIQPILTFREVLKHFFWREEGRRGGREGGREGEMEGEREEVIRKKERINVRSLQPYSSALIEMCWCHDSG